MKLRIRMVSEDGKDWSPMAYCDNHVKGNWIWDDGRFSAPAVQVVQLLLSVEGDAVRDTKTRRELS